jgi:predicted DNA-binding mobile mystery protein A
MRTTERELDRIRLDDAFATGSLWALADPPARGWIREIREALGMTTRQLAARMGRSQAAVSQLERSEVTGGARLESLRRAAEALGCDLVYVLVPRTSLDDTMQTRARVLARRGLASLDGAPAAALDPRIDALADGLLAGGRLWDDRDAN